MPLGPLYNRCIQLVLFKIYQDEITTSHEVRIKNSFFFNLQLTKYVTMATSIKDVFLQSNYRDCLNLI